MYSTGLGWIGCLTIGFQFSFVALFVLLASSYDNDINMLGCQTHSTFMKGYITLNKFLTYVNIRNHLFVFGFQNSIKNPGNMDVIIYKIKKKELYKTSPF